LLFVEFSAYMRGYEKSKSIIFRLVIGIFD